MATLTDTLKSITRGMPAMVTGGAPAYRAGEKRLAWKRVAAEVPDSIRVSSTAFPAGGSLPIQFTGDGKSESPPIAWSHLPEGTRSVVLICEDPDAPTPEPYVHWLVYDLPPVARELPERIRPGEQGVHQGLSSNLRAKYLGAAPPRGDLPHHYHFQIFALDRELGLAPGMGRTSLLRSMRGHVMARGEVVGTYAH